MTRNGFLKSLMAGTVVGIPAVKSVETLNVGPSDKLVFTFPSHLSDYEVAKLRETVQRELPGQRVLVLCGGAELKVLKG